MEMELEIECLWHTDESRALDDKEEDYPVSILEPRTMTFYHIDALAPAKFYCGTDICYIFVGSEKFTSAYDIEKTKELIFQAKIDWKQKMKHY